jgi:1-acyl-sn-glycerol-3-phosphate acyltransferase
VSRLLWRLSVDAPHGFPSPPFVIAANHYSFLDPPIVGAVFGKRARFLALFDLVGNYRLLDFALKLFEVIPVRRGSRQVAVVRQAMAHLKSDGVVAVFPEGTRAPRFGHLPFAAGAAWLATKTGVPLVPVAIIGTDRVLGIDNRLRRGRIRVTVGPPLKAEGSAREMVDRLTGQWAEWITANIDQRAQN